MEGSEVEAVVAVTHGIVRAESSGLVLADTEEENIAE
jgi:hypothetical protein